MADLIAQSPCAGILPVTVGQITLAEADLGPMTAVMPFAGCEAKTSDALKRMLGAGFPQPNASTTAEGVSILWAGRGKAFVTGRTVDPVLSEHAALVDQSDSWAAIDVSAPKVDAVFARLVPVDLRENAFPVGAVRQTLLAHMTCGLVRIAPDTIRVLVFRSMSATAVHDIVEAARGLAARP